MGKKQTKYKLEMKTFSRTLADNLRPLLRSSSLHGLWAHRPSRWYDPSAFSVWRCQEGTTQRTFYLASQCTSMDCDRKDSVDTLRCHQMPSCPTFLSLWPALHAFKSERWLKEKRPFSQLTALLLSFLALSLYSPTWGDVEAVGQEEGHFQSITGVSPF